jgi:hypothetical protein
VGARRGDFRFLRVCNQRANESRSSVLITRSAGMPLFRAIAKPQRVEEAISPVEMGIGVNPELATQFDPTTRSRPHAPAHLNLW